MDNKYIQTYPVILHPSQGATLVLPLDSNLKQKNKPHGQSELVAFARFFKYGCSEIREDVCVRICGHNYEPDFAYINKEKSIYIDIEVDEPYSASRHPTHFLLDDGTNKDSVRNKRFQDAGWYVIRFSEEQIFCHTRECLKEIYKLALSSGAIDELPKSLQATNDLTPTPRWSNNDSYHMIRQHFRKKYLGYDPTHMGLRGYLRCSWLILPIMWQSIWNTRVRHEMCRQLKEYFLHK